MSQSRFDKQALVNIKSVLKFGSVAGIQWNLARIQIGFWITVNVNDILSKCDFDLFLFNLQGGI